jgi:hypothetical protein
MRFIVVSFFFALVSCGSSQVKPVKPIESPRPLSTIIDHGSHTPYRQMAGVAAVDNVKRLSANGEIPWSAVVFLGGSLMVGLLLGAGSGWVAGGKRWALGSALFCAFFGVAVSGYFCHRFSFLFV